MAHQRGPESDAGQGVVMEAPAEAREPASAAPSTSAPPKGGRSRRGLRLALIAIALLGLGTGAYYGNYWWTTGRYLVTTDDAYVGAKAATLSPKISGYIADVAVEDNASVKAGDVIARIDDGDYKLAVQTARDQVAVQQASVARIDKQVAAQRAAVEQAQAQLASAKAGETRAELDYKRQQELATRQINSRQSLEQSQANYDQAVAAVRAAEAAVQSASANVDVLLAQKEEAARAVAQSQTALAKAERDLSFTVIRAPFDGVVGNRAMQVGDYVQPTQRLASLVPLDAVYIDANFKETQVSRLQPGQPVRISVDALPDHDIEGRVASVSPASGSVFSLLPPDNATGNFTKVVQRLPVRILVPATVAEKSMLRPGMSVVVSVNTKAGAPVTNQRMGTAAVRTGTY
ncbi:MAG TPA: HlyD family secretion protein [Hyphomicrobiaceae bacterium]|jgi:membrane fusion protein (multidrug efflux system)|nr:HlyD family secretion protein [Hyphomicrobiaceae bacterium]